MVPCPLDPASPDVDALRRAPKVLLHDHLDGGLQPQTVDRAGAHRTVHAGEAAGLGSIRAALDGASAERLGHGVRIADDVAADGSLGPLAQRAPGVSAATPGRGIAA